MQASRRHPIDARPAVWSHELANNLRGAMIDDVLTDMHALYLDNPVKAVRGQGFIKILHGHIAEELESRLTPWAIKRGIYIKPEAKIYGSHKPKNVDVAVIDPTNGPLLAVGVRSQMSSIGKNALTYYQDIVGECISLQDRFPMCTYGYAYLHPLASIKEGKEGESIDHERFARLYEAISGRDGRAYTQIRGVYDEFAYMVVDFAQSPPTLRDDIVAASVEMDLTIATLVNRLIAKFKARHIWLEVFT